MALASPSSTAQPVELEPAPLLLPWDLRLTPEQFERVCQANPEAVLELAADGTMIAMTPTGGETGSRNGLLVYQLQVFCRQRRKAWRLFDSSTDFRLPDGSVLSPDASLVLEERWQVLTPQQRRSFPPLCPDLVVELASASDEGLPGQWHPFGLVAAPGAAGCGDLALRPAGDGGAAGERQPDRGR